MTTHVIVIICRYYPALFWIELSDHEYTQPFSAILLEAHNFRFSKQPHPTVLKPVAVNQLVTAIVYPMVVLVHLVWSCREWYKKKCLIFKKNFY